MSLVFQKYMGTGLIVMLFMVALVYLFLCEKRKPVRILFVYVPVLILLIVFNPLFFNLFTGFVGEEIYFRFCWLLPIVVVIAMSVISVCERLKGGMRIGFAVVAIAMLVVSGKWVYSSALFTRAENVYHVPQKVVDICDAIIIEGREVMAAFPEEFLLYVRQYTPFVCMPYGRTGVEGGYTEFYELMCRDEIEVKTLAMMAKEQLCHYVILPEDKVLVGDMEEYSYEVFETMHGYIIYKDTTMNFGLK